MKVITTTCLCAQIFHAARITIIKSYFVLGNEAHCLLDAADATTFVKDSSILAGQNDVSLLPCSVVLTGGRHYLDVAGSRNRVDLVEFWVHIQVRTWMKAVLKRKYSELECISSTGVHRPNIYCCSTVSLHISHFYCSAVRGLRVRKLYPSPIVWGGYRIKYKKYTLTEAVFERHSQHIARLLRECGESC